MVGDGTFFVFFLASPPSILQDFLSLCQQQDVESPYQDSGFPHQASYGYRNREGRSPENSSRLPYILFTNIVYLA